MFSKGRSFVVAMSFCARSMRRGSSIACSFFASSCAASPSAGLSNCAPYQGESPGPYLNSPRRAALMSVCAASLRLDAMAASESRSRRAVVDGGFSPSCSLASS
jgi:hypothetical protein